MGTYINKSQGADFDKWKIAFGVRLLINDLSNKIIRNYGKYKENSKYFRKSSKINNDYNNRIIYLYVVF
jgi:hypothetical protein